MKQFKRMIAALMIAVFMIPSGVGAVEAKAATACSSPAEVTRVLEDMASIYRGKFWNASLSDSALRQAVANGYSDPYRSISLAERQRALGLTDKPGNTSNNFNGWTTCTGFARYIFYVLFGQALPSYKDLVKNPAKYNVTVYSGNSLNGLQLQAGDFIYEHSPHAAVVMKNVNGKVHVVEGNVNNGDYIGQTKAKYNNYINWDNPASNADGYWGYRYSYGKSHNNDTLVQTMIQNDGYVVRYNFSSNSGGSSSAPAPAPEESALSINGVSAIGTIKEGNTYPIDGTVTSNYNITNVTGTIYDSNGNTLYTKSVNPGKTSYTLKYSKVDNAMLFNYLAPGEYTYKVSASDTAGGYRENSQKFNIESKNAEAEARAREEAEARAREEAEARAREEAEARAREEAETKARQEAAAKAAEDAAKAAEQASKQEEQQTSNTQTQSNSCNSRQDIIVLPDYDREEITLTGDTGKYDLHVSRNSGTEIFTAASDRLTIITRGQVEDLVCGGIRTDASKHFSMYLYDVTDGYERYVSGYYANCDNIEGGLEFDVQEGHQYKIRFDTTGLSYKEAVIGDGHVYPVR